MMIVWIEADKIVEKKVFTNVRGKQIKGQRPDFVILEEDEADRIWDSDRIEYLEREVVPALRKPSWNNILVRVDDELVKFEKRY